MTLWRVARQSPLSMRFSRQKYWSGLPCPPPGDPADPGAEPCLLCLLGLMRRQMCSVPLVTLGKPQRIQSDYPKSKVKEFYHRMVQCMLILENVLFLKTHTHTHTQKYTKSDPMRGHLFLILKKKPATKIPNP